MVRPEVRRTCLTTLRSRLTQPLTCSGEVALVSDDSVDRFRLASVVAPCRIVIPLTVIGVLVLVTLRFRQICPWPRRALVASEPLRPAVVEVRVAERELPPWVAVKTGSFAQKARAAAVLAFVVPCGTGAPIRSWWCWMCACIAVLVLTVTATYFLPVKWQTFVFLMFGGCCFATAALAVAASARSAAMNASVER